jgi:glycosyltransferase involved in cell wall biosynthesis
MRLLWLKMGGLWPLNTGGRQRSLQMIADLSRRHAVQVVTTAGPADDADGLAARLSQCEQVTSVPFGAAKQGSAAFLGALAGSWCSPYPVDLWRWRPAEVRRLVETRLARHHIDLIVADFLCGAVNLPRRVDVPVVFFEHNVEYVIWKRLADVERAWWRRALLEVEWRKMRRCELAACRKADLTVAVSEDDRARLASGAGEADIVSIPTGVDTDYFSPGGTEQPARLVFSGSMDWYPNEDAMLHFVGEILPRVKQRVPDVSLTIVGRNPSERIRALGQQPGIDVTGTVADVRPHIREGSLYVVPLRVGGGTRLKIFEALAMGKPVLSTTVGAEGLGAVPGRHLDIADGPGVFADRVVALLGDPGQRASLGAEGRALVESQYSWAQVTRTFENFLEGVAARRGRAGARAPQPDEFIAQST